MDKETRDTLDFFRLSENTRELRRVLIQGDLFRFIYDTTVKRPRPGGGRGVIKGFSKASRWRLLQQVGIIDWKRTRMNMFATLTYPDDVAPTNSYDTNKHRYLWHRKVEKLTGRKVPGMWRIEWVARKSGPLCGEILPHFHIILFDIGYIQYKELRRAWADVIGAKREPSVRFERMRKGTKVGRYIAKYVAKVPDATNLDNSAYLNRGGRHYGYLRKGLIPVEVRRWSPQLSVLQAEELLALSREWCPEYASRMPQSFAALGARGKAALVRFLKWGLTLEQMVM